MSNFAPEQYIAELIKIIGRPPLTDISSEVSQYSINCIIMIIDIFPDVITTLIQLEGIKVLSEKLYELGESAIKVFEKIAEENPQALL